MTDRELLQQALDALIDAARLMDDEGYTVAFQEEVIITIRARLSQCDRCGEVNPAEIHTCTPQFQPDWDAMAVMVEEQQRMAKRIEELEGQLAQPAYRRGDRLLCIETDEHCIIHVSGTDRQWIKFPDSHVGVYTNEQVAEMFELMPKESI